MLKALQKIPAGTFIIPMLLGMIFATIWPDTLVNMGGMTEALFSRNATPSLIAIITFASGASLNLKTIGPVLKRHGTLFLAKIIIGLVLSFAFLYIFGLDGVWGIPAVAFVAVILSQSPPVWLAVNKEMGNDEAGALMGLIGILSLPILSQVVFTIYMSSGSGGESSFNFMPVISSLLPLVVGVILGNLDEGFRNLFSPAVSILMPLLGWSIGQGLNLTTALQSGFSGILLALIFFVLMSSLILVDRGLLKEDGTAGVAFLSIAGSSSAVPATLAAAYPVLEPYVSTAPPVIVAVVILSSFLNPIVAKAYKSKFVDA